MTAYEMKLSFMEIEPVFNDNYEDDDYTGPYESGNMHKSKGVPAKIGY